MGIATSTLSNGALAMQTATHTVALCNLVIDGQVKGLYWFIVPLRSLRDGTLLPGVSAGFLGPRAVRTNQHFFYKLRTAAC
jgi:acyl-CoA oxidase